jgi:hypothetical protein
MAKFKVSIGKPFAVDGVEIEDVEAVERLAAIDERRALARNQARLTYGVLGVLLAAMALATFIGWRDGSYDELYAVWSAGGFWAGLVLGRYFKKD